MLKLTRVKIVKNTVANGKAVNIGRVLELEEPEARTLVACKKAVLYVLEGAKSGSSDSEVLATGGKGNHLEGAKSGRK